MGPKIMKEKEVEESEYWEYVYLSGRSKIFYRIGMVSKKVLRHAIVEMKRGYVY